MADTKTVVTDPKDGKAHTLAMYRRRLKRFDANEMLKNTPEAMRLRKGIAEMEKALGVTEEKEKPKRRRKRAADDAGEPTDAES